MKSDNSNNSNIKEKTIARGIQNPCDTQIKMMLNQCKKSPCLLCGGVPIFIGVFSPGSGKSGAAPGKERQYFYSLCKNCVTSDGWEARVQNRIGDETNGMEWR